MAAIQGEQAKERHRDTTADVSIPKILAVFRLGSGPLKGYLSLTWEEAEMLVEIIQLLPGFDWNQVKFTSEDFSRITQSFRRWASRGVKAAAGARLGKLTPESNPRFNLQRADLQHVFFEAYGSYPEGNFRQANLGKAFFFRASCPSADFSRAVLREANLVRAKCARALFIKADLQDAQLTEAKLMKANFKRARLMGAKFEHALLHEATFEGAQLRGADFRGAQLEGVDFRGAQLVGADFSEGAQLRGADFRGAQLKGAIFQGAQLTGAQMHGAYLQGASLEGAIRDGIILRPDTIRLITKAISSS
jgi:uncharacterized protein YjbI with pentapeptide repeats